MLTYLFYPQGLRREYWSSVVIGTSSLSESLSTVHLRLGSKFGYGLTARDGGNADIAGAIYLPFRSLFGSSSPQSITGRGFHCPRFSVHLGLCLIRLIFSFSFSPSRDATFTRLRLSCPLCLGQYEFLRAPLPSATYSPLSRAMAGLAPARSRPCRSHNNIEANA